METVEFSRLVNLNEPELKQKKFSFAATPEECKALSVRFEIVLQSLKGEATFRDAGDGVSTCMEGQLKAHVVQDCGVSLEAFGKAVETSFVVYFSPQGSKKTAHFEGEDQEFYLDPEVDVGEVISQYLCLSMGTYARSPEATFETQEGSEVRPNPFAELKARLDKQGSDT